MSILETWINEIVQILSKEGYEASNVEKIARSNEIKIRELLPELQMEVFNFLIDITRGTKQLVKITCAYRSMQDQQKEYNKGRVTTGKIVTFAKPGQSYHQHRAAVDVVVIDRSQKACWRPSAYTIMHSYLDSYSWHSLKFESLHFETGKIVYNQSTSKHEWSR